MASGAPTPGGLKAPPAGGYHAPPAGVGLNQNAPGTAMRIRAGYPRVSITQDNTTATNTTPISRTAVQQLGAATSGTYAWTVTTRPGGSVATLTTPTAATMGFTTDGIGVYIFTCTVTFSNGVVDAATTKHTAT